MNGQPQNHGKLMSSAPHFNIDLASFWADPYPALRQMRSPAPLAFALPLSAECLKDITGLTNMRYQDMDTWSQAMIDGIANYSGDPHVAARCHAATAGIDAAIDDMIPVLQKQPNASMLSALLAAGM